jgi:hypothetical protein
MDTKKTPTGHPETQPSGEKQTAATENTNLGSKGRFIWNPSDWTPVHKKEKEGEAQEAGPAE